MHYTNAIDDTTREFKSKLTDLPEFTTYQVRGFRRIDASKTKHGNDAAILELLQMTNQMDTEEVDIQEIYITNKNLIQRIVETGCGFKIRTRAVTKCLIEDREATYMPIDFVER